MQKPPSSPHSRQAFNPRLTPPPVTNHPSWPPPLHLSPDVEVDSDWLARVMGGGGRQAAEAAAAGQAPDMSGEEIAALKRR